MKKQTKQRIGAGIAIGSLTLATIFGATACKEIEYIHGEDCKCSDCETPAQPTAQTATINLAPGKTMVINYDAVTGTTPEWWNILISTLVNRQAGFGAGEYILNVESGGTAGFVSAGPGSRTATVSEAYLLNTDYETIRNDIGTSGGAWTAMLEMFDNSKNTVRMAFAATRGRSA